MQYCCSHLFSMLIAQATDAKRPRKRAGDAHGCEDLIGFAAQGSVHHLLAAIVFSVFCVVIQALAMPYGNYKRSETPCHSNNLLALCADVSLLFFLGGVPRPV